METDSKTKELNFDEFRDEQLENIIKHLKFKRSHEHRAIDNQFLNNREIAYLIHKYYNLSVIDEETISKCLEACYVWQVLWDFSGKKNMKSYAHDVEAIVDKKLKEPLFGMTGEDILKPENTLQDLDLIRRRGVGGYGVVGYVKTAKSSFRNSQ